MGTKVRGNDKGPGYETLANLGFTISVSRAGKLADLGVVGQ